jgi:hypothetical protein
VRHRSTAARTTGASARGAPCPMPSSTRSTPGVRDRPRDDDRSDQGDTHGRPPAMCPARRESPRRSHRACPFGRYD